MTQPPVDTGPTSIPLGMVARLVDSGLAVPCVDGVARTYVNFDYAATTPSLVTVIDAIMEFLPWYGSAARGSGFTSSVATAALEGTREAVGAFVGKRDDDVVVFVRNTTEAVNVLAAALPEAATILVSPAEHHANLLPWRRRATRMLPFASSAEHLIEECERSLRTADGAVTLVAITGASNVTGEVLPIAELASVVHRYGAELFLDAAQLAPHRPIDMAELGVDYLAFSGHKLYAPFGAGALVGQGRGLRRGSPLLEGGGAVKSVTLDDVVWAEPPQRYEAGSPNVIGVVALGVACRTLAEIGMERVATHERVLANHLHAGLARVPGLTDIRLWPGSACDRLGVSAFVVEHVSSHLVAAALGAEHGIGVRAGRFCAHPLVEHLLSELPNASEDDTAVRASIGLGTTTGQIDVLVEALTELSTTGPAWTYVRNAATGRLGPENDPRGLPELAVPMLLTDETSETSTT